MDWGGLCSFRPAPHRVSHSCPHNGPVLRLSHVESRKLLPLKSSTSFPPGTGSLF